VHLVENYRDDKAKTKQRIIKRYGELSELQAQESDILDRLKAEAKELTRIKASSKVSLEIDCLRPRTEDEHPVNYGYFFFEALYRKLGLHTFFKKHKPTGRKTYDLGAITELLVYSRMLCPASKSATVAGKNRFFRDFDCELHDVYHALDDLNRYADDVCLHVHSQVTKYWGRDAALVFYDVTNYYFECDLEDDFRKRGPSKERRKDPIVQMGLLIDEAGIPITYRLFEGNTHDAKTLVPVLEELKAKYGFGRIIVVADKGLNGKDNLDFIVSGADGYIVSQKVRGRVAPEIAAHIADRSGWTFNDAATFAYKSFVRKHKVAKNKQVDEKVVCYWSEHYAKREAHRRGDLVDGIEYLVAHPGAYNCANDYGRKRYVKEHMVTAQGEIVDKVLTFNEERFAADAALDGFYCILTSETDMSDTDIIKHYHGLARIEESFRVIKSELVGRPVFVWTPPRINAHFLICFLALTLLRLVQVKMDYSLSAAALIAGLQSAQATSLEKGIYVVEETAAPFKELEKTFGVSLPVRYAPVETLKAYRRKIIAGV
jgi:transposase